MKMMKKSVSSASSSKRELIIAPSSLPASTPGGSSSTLGRKYLPNGHIPEVSQFHQDPSEPKYHYWSTLNSKEPYHSRPHQSLRHRKEDGVIGYEESSPPNFRLNFVKKMEDPVLLRLPQGSCDTTPDTPDSLDDDSIDRTSLPPTLVPGPLPVAELPLPQPPLHGQAKSPDPWLMRDNLVEEVTTPIPVRSSESSPTTPMMGSPTLQSSSLYHSASIHNALSQVRLNEIDFKRTPGFNGMMSKVKPGNNNNVISGKHRVYASLYPQMAPILPKDVVPNNNNSGDKGANLPVFDDNDNYKSKDSVSIPKSKSAIIEDNFKLRKKTEPVSRYATIGSRNKRSTINNSNSRLLNANLSSSTLHCSKGDSSSVLLPKKLYPPPYQDPPKYRKPKTTVSMENNPANSSSSCFTIESAMNSLNNNGGNPREDVIQSPEKETKNEILQDLQKHTSYELLENPRHITTDEDEEEIEKEDTSIEGNHVEADVRITTSLLQIKSKSLPTIARMRQQNQLTNGHCYKLSGDHSEPDPNDSLSTLNEVNSSKIANLSSASSSMINKLRHETTNREVLDKDHIDLDGGTVRDRRSRVDSIVDRDILDHHNEKKRKSLNGPLISNEPESSRISSTDEDFETTDDERRSRNHHRKYRRKRTTPDSIDETEDDEDDLPGEEEDPEMEFCDPCHCYGKCCLDMVASIFCVSLL